MPYQTGPSQILNDTIPDNNSASKSSRISKGLIIVITLLILAGVLNLLYFMIFRDKIINKNEEVPTEGECILNGVSFEIGATIPSIDTCNSCLCTDMGVSCTLRDCDDSDPEIQRILTLRVFFAEPLSPEDFETTGAVERSSSATALYPIALQQLIAGPTELEKEEGYTSAFQLVGESNCNGNDFGITIQGTVLTVQFCKTIEWESNPNLSDSWAGISIAGTARAITTIEETLKFGGIQTIIIKDKDGNCYGQDAGKNMHCEV